MYNGNIIEHIMGIEHVLWEYITTHGWNRMVMQQNTGWERAFLIWEYYISHDVNALQLQKYPMWKALNT